MIDIEDDTHGQILARTAVRKVYDTPELLERILDNLDNKTLRKLMPLDRTLLLIAHRVIAKTHVFNERYVKGISEDRVSQRRLYLKQKSS